MPRQGGVRVVSAQTAHCSVHVTTTVPGPLTGFTPPQPAAAGTPSTVAAGALFFTSRPEQHVAMDTFLHTPRLRACLGIALAFFILSGPAVPGFVGLGPSGQFSFTAAAAPLPANLGWGWPLAGKPAVVGSFDPPSKPWLSGHRGIDLAAPQGTAVLAPVDGTVSFSGVVVNRGVLTIATANGLRLSFEPVDSTLHAGDAVFRGQSVGVVQGPSHCDAGPPGSCLHWGVRRGETYLDPLQFLMDLRPSILLPLNRG